MSDTSQLSFDELTKIAAQGNCISVLAELTASLAFGDDEAGALVSDLLREVESVPDEQAEKLLPLAGHTSPPVAAWACKLLARSGLGDKAESAIRQALISHGNNNVRQEAARAAGGLKHISSETRAALTAACDSDDPRLARLAEQALASQGTA